MTAIPEDEPLLEELKVVRPLNEVKNDQVNYHQIIRAYNTKLKMKTQSRHPSRPQTGNGVHNWTSPSHNNNISGKLHNVDNISSGGKMKVIKKQFHPPPDMDLDLIEPDDNAEFIHPQQDSTKSKKQIRNPLA